MDAGQVLVEFKKRYGHLSQLGLEIHGIANLIENYSVISVSTPFMFDKRQLPKEFMGLEIRGGIPLDQMPPEFQSIDKGEGYLWAYQRFENYVDQNADSIRTALNKPLMTRDEMLDALCYGDFKEHKVKCLVWESEGKIPKWKE